MKRQIYAIINLGFYFALHIFRLVFRFFLRKAPGLDRFNRNYRPEGFFPLAPREREDLFRLSGCIGCGLCRMTLGTGSSGRTGLSDPESLALCLSRAMPELGAARASLDRDRDSYQPASFCPRGVSFSLVYDFIQGADKEKS